MRNHFDFCKAAIEKSHLAKTVVLLFNRQAVFERFAHRLAENDVGVVCAIKRNRSKFLHVDFAVREHALVCRYVDYTASHRAGFAVIIDKLALDCKGQFVDDGSVYSCAVRNRESGFCKFVGIVVCRNKSEIVSLFDVFCRRHRHRKRLSFKDIFHGFVSFRQTHRDLLVVADTTSRRIHCVYRSVFIVTCDDEHGHRIKPRFCTEILSHLLPPHARKSHFCDLVIYPIYFFVNTQEKPFINPRRFAQYTRCMRQGMRMRKSMCPI